MWNDSYEVVLIKFIYFIYNCQKSISAEVIMMQFMVRSESPKKRRAYFSSLNCIYFKEIKTASWEKLATASKLDNITNRERVSS